MTQHGFLDGDLRDPGARTSPINSRSSGQRREFFAVHIAEHYHCPLGESVVFTVIPSDTTLGAR